MNADAWPNALVYALLLVLLLVGRLLEGWHEPLPRPGDGAGRS